MSVPEGLEIAAAYIEQKVNLYLDRHTIDGEEYVYILERLAEEIRALDATPKPKLQQIKDYNNAVHIYANMPDELKRDFKSHVQDTWEHLNPRAQTSEAAQ